MLEIHFLLAPLRYFISNSTSSNTSFEDVGSLESDKNNSKEKRNLEVWPMFFILNVISALEGTL